MNNKPIAWYNADDSSLSFKNHGGGWEPLYLHPAKTLTDEEIEALKKAVLKTIPTLKWSEDLLREAQHDEAVSDIQDCIVALRLAIRKAQENG